MNRSQLPDMQTAAYRKAVKHLNAAIKAIEEIANQSTSYSELETAEYWMREIHSLISRDNGESGLEALIGKNERVTGWTGGVTVIAAGEKEEK